MSDNTEDFLTSVEDDYLETVILLGSQKSKAQLLADKGEERKLRGPASQDQATLLVYLMG